MSDTVSVDSPLLPPGQELRILIVGIGGVASYLLNHSLLGLLANSFPKSVITLCDKDELEERNFIRQDFASSAVGNKAQAKTDQLIADQRYKALDFRCVPQWITPENVTGYVQDGDIVFSCADNHATRRVLSDHLENLSSGVLIAGGNSEYTSSTLVYIRWRGEDLTLPLTAQSAEIANPKEKGPWQMSCEELAVVAPQLALANEDAAIAMKKIFFLLTRTSKIDYAQVRGNILTNTVYAVKMNRNN